MTESPLAITLRYHEETKHHLHRYARSLGYLDWATQPDPFRTYRGAPVTELPLTADRLSAPYAALFVPGAIPAAPLDRGSIGACFELALGLSAWKRYGTSRWALRCNPSSGNLHPTEGYLLARGIPGVPDGVHHYVSRDHLLEHRAAVTLPLPEGVFLVGLTSIFWREAWKYGERAFRYCQHDLGHAIATVRYAAATLGWRAELLEAPSDDDIAALLGLECEPPDPAIEREHSQALIVVGPAATSDAIDLDPLVAAARDAPWVGTPNRLSPSHVDWPILAAVATATRKPRTPGAAAVPRLAARAGPPPADGPTAARLIRQRRSAVALDGRTGLTPAGLADCLDRLVPREATPPWDALPWSPLVHPVLMLHRIGEIDPGLYVQPRDPTVARRLRAAMRPDFDWQPIAAPEPIRLYHLLTGDARRAAQTIACHQEIAADGAFALGMLADYEATLRDRGPWWYRRLFWEAGVLGQALYLEAEALGVRATGIGCYFDDLFHELLGLTDAAFQSLYHFTVGGPVEDPRLQSEPPYAHLRR